MEKEITFQTTNLPTAFNICKVFISPVNPLYTPKQETVASSNNVTKEKENWKHYTLCQYFLLFAPLKK